MPNQGLLMTVKVVPRTLALRVRFGHLSLCYLPIARECGVHRGVVEFVSFGLVWRVNKELMESTGFFAELVSKE